jgi:hypothetical protein
MGLAVDTASEPADDHDSRSGQLAGERASDLGAVATTGPSTDDRDAWAREQLGATPPKIEPGRRIVDRREMRRESSIGAGEHPEHLIAHDVPPSSRGAR